MLWVVEWANWRKGGDVTEAMAIGVLFGDFGRKIGGDSWFTGWFNHLPGPSISPKRRLRSEPVSRAAVPDCALLMSRSIWAIILYGGSSKMVRGFQADD